MCPLTCSSLICKGADLSSVMAAGRSDGGSGCFDRSSSSVSRSTFAGLSLEHRILTAALMFPSSNLDATAAANVCSSLKLFLRSLLLFVRFCVVISSHLRGHSVRKLSTLLLMVVAKLWRLPPFLVVPGYQLQTSAACASAMDCLRP